MHRSFRPCHRPRSQPWLSRPFRIQATFGRGYRRRESSTALTSPKRTRLPCRAASSIQSRADLHNPDMRRALHGLTTAVKSVRSRSESGRTTAAKIVGQAELKMAGPAQRTGLFHWEAALRYRESFIEDAPLETLALRKAGVLFSADRNPIHPHQ